MTSGLEIQSFVNKRERFRQRLRWLSAVSRAFFLFGSSGFLPNSPDWWYVHFQYHRLFFSSMYSSIYHKRTHITSCISFSVVVLYSSSFDRGYPSYKVHCIQCCIWNEFLIIRLRYNANYIYSIYLYIDIYLYIL